MILSCHLFIDAMKDTDPKVEFLLQGKDHYILLFTCKMMNTIRHGTASANNFQRNAHFIIFYKSPSFEK